MREGLASRKVVWSNPCTEVSEIAKIGTDEQELHIEAMYDG